MSAFRIIDDSDNQDNDGFNQQARFTVIGVGGGGGNAVEHMVRSGITGINFVCANTDNQALSRMSSPIRIQLGVQATRGLGAGANPEVGRTSALEEVEAIREVVQGTDMLFVTAGMGGGTGTGAAPIVAKTAKEAGVLVVGVVTSPFEFEGFKRRRIAEKGIEELKEHVDSLIIIPNEKLLSVYGDIALTEAYKKADDVLLTAVRSIFDLIVNPGLVNLDFADLRTVMSNRGYAMMGIGSATGENRANLATQAAIRSKLLDNIRLKDAKGVVINITAGNNVSTNELKEVMSVASAIADMEESDFIYGTVIDPEMTDELRVTVIATGLERSESTSNHDLPPMQSPATQSPASHIATPSAPAIDPDAPAIDRRGSVDAPHEINRQNRQNFETADIHSFLKNQQKDKS